jgi:predicted branched-subunit amino acid permease
VGVDGQHRRVVDDAIAQRRATFRSGQLAIVPTLFGTGAWAMVSGVAMVKSGLAVHWAMMLSALAYAGSAQLAALPLIAAGAPLWVIIATALFTNLRFVIYSAALRPHLAHLSGRRRALLGYFTSDFSFTLFMRRAQEGTLPAENRDAWFAGACASNWMTWQICALIGIVASSYVPTKWGLEFTGTLALLALMGPSLVARPAITGAIVAAGVALLAHSMPYKLGLFCAAIAGIIAASVVDSWKHEEPAAPMEST